MKHDLRLGELKAERSVNIDYGRVGRGNTRLGVSVPALVEQTQRSLIERESGDAEVAFGVNRRQPYVGRSIFERSMQEADRFARGAYSEDILARGTPGQCRTHPVNVPPVSQFPGKAWIGMIAAELKCFARDAIDFVKILWFYRPATKSGCWNFRRPYAGQDDLKVKVN